MNSVHEPGSQTTSKNRLRNNTESNRIENKPSAPSAQPVASPFAQAARLPLPAGRCRAPATACPAPARPCRAPAPMRLPACLPASPSACPPARPACCRTPACAPYTRPVPCLRKCSGYIAIHPCPFPCLVTIQFFFFCIAIQSPYSHVSCNTMPSSLLPAIQYLYCNTLQPSSPFKLQYKPCLATQKFLCTIRFGQ